MSPEVIGGVCILAMLVLLYARMWIGLAMLFVGFWGIYFVVGWDVSLKVIATVPYRTIADYVLSVLPLFMLMGVLVSNTGMASDLFYTAHKWVGQLKGGLAIATVAACAAFAAVVSISTVSAITMGKAALPEMKKFKYDERLAAGCVAMGGTIGVMIPPSMAFILYGILTKTSIGSLFMAGIIPGLIQAGLYIALIYTRCRLNPAMGPAGPKTTFKEKAVSLKNTWAMLMLFLLVIGGIYLGIFTPTEAGAIGSFGAIVISTISRRMTKKIFLGAILETAEMTAMVIVLIVGAFIFTKLMALSQLPFAMGDIIAGLSLSPYVILIIIIIIYILLGMFLDVMSCILITVPILFPVVTALGFDPIWYGVIMVKVIQMGVVTPPIGMDVFVLSGTSGVPIATIFRGVIPFVIADIVMIVVLVAFPILSLWIPGSM
jgi:tripartite ATP-independent transporter DctM subunit